MPARETKFSLKEFTAGEEWTLEKANAVIRAIKQNAYMHHGISSENSYGVGQKLHNQPETVQITAGENIPAYSIFGVCLSGTDYNPPMCVAKKIGGGGSLLGLFTNGEIPLDEDQKAIVEPVGFYRPVRVRVTGTTPLVGEPCGVELNTFGVSNSMQGMVCLSDVYSPSSGFATEYIWAMRSADMSSVIGEVTTLAPAYDIGTQTPGAGVLKIQFRDPSTDELVDAVRPGTGGAVWSLPFYNFSITNVTVGLKVRAEATLGVGLSVFEVQGSTPVGVPFYNNSGETIPPGGVMYAINALDIAGTPYIEAVKPDTPFSRFWLINGPTPVADLGTSLGSFLTDLVGFVALGSTLAGSPDTIEWGAKPGSWLLWPDRPGFTLLNDYEIAISGQQLAYFKQRVVNDVFGKWYEDLTKDNQAEFEIWYRNDAGTLFATDWDKLLVYDRWLRGGEVIKAGEPGTAHWYSSWWEAGERAETNLFRGITNAALNKGSTVANGVSRYLHGTETDSGIDDTVRNDWANVGSGKKVGYMRSGSGLYLVSAECPLT